MGTRKPDGYGFGQNLKPVMGMGFLMGIDIFHGYRFGTAKPSGFVPVAISTPKEVIGKFVSFELMIKGSKKIIEQGASSSVPEAQPVAFKATEEKKEDSTPSRIPIDASKLDNEEMALIIKSFHQILKQRKG
jgi:hypothetical protein